MQSYDMATSERQYLLPSRVGLRPPLEQLSGSRTRLYDSVQPRPQELLASSLFFADPKPAPSPEDVEMGVGFYTKIVLRKPMC